MKSKADVSPVKPRLVQTTFKNKEVFFFENPGNRKKIGVSPNGKTKIALNKFEGKSHNRIRSLDNEKLIMSGASPVKSPHKTSFDAQMMKLEVKLIDLKDRVDKDYETYVENGQIDENHYKFCRNEIKKCIKQLKISYKLAKDKDEFINAFNKRVESDEIYNPVSLQKLYPKTGYDRVLAAQDFNHNLLKEDLCVAPIPLNLTPETTNKRKGFFDTQFVPRSVKTKQEKSQDKMEMALL